MKLFDITHTDTEIKINLYSNDVLVESITINQYMRFILNSKKLNKLLFKKKYKKYFKRVSKKLMKEC